MRIRRLFLRKFRNIEEEEFFPSPGVNFLQGSNGQGKTSILEALSFVSNLRSFRGAKPIEMLRWESDFSEIICDIDLQETTTNLKVVFSCTDPKRVRVQKAAFINGNPFHSSLEYLCQRFGAFELGFHSIAFNPSDHELVRGEPALRRKYLDRVLSAENEGYLRLLQKYKRLLDQRNALLKQHSSGARISSEERALFQGFSKPFCETGSQITFARIQWLNRLNKTLGAAVSRVAPTQGKIQTKYESTWFENPTGHAELTSLELLETALWKKLTSVESAERAAGFSLVGPHRDDWGFSLGSMALKGHGSQGEVRTALLGLKLSELVLFREATGHRPVFLLDDFSSELDQERRRFLLQFLEETDLQVFVTTTEGFALVGKRFVVSAGKVKELRDDRI